MTQRIRTFSRLGWFLALVLVTTAIAADSPLPSGKVVLESKSISVGVGVSWGEGTLNLKGIITNSLSKASRWLISDLPRRTRSGMLTI